MKKFLVVPAMALALLASGCNTPGERAVGGAAIGGLAGAGVGALVGGGRGAVIGGLAGAAGGAVIGAATTPDECPYGYYRYRDRLYCR